MTTNSTIVVTGSLGFLGSHLCEAALRRGHYVIGIDNLSTGSASHEAYLKNLMGLERFHQIHTDVVDWDPRQLQPQGELLYWFHFASPASPPAYQRLALETLWVNSRGLENCLRGAQQWGGRVVFASTSEIYGDPLEHPQRETYWGNVNTLGPRSCYDEAKRFGEALIYTWNKVYKSQHGLIRIFNTYGPRMNPADGRVVINFLEQARRGSKLTVYGTGQQTRSYCYVDDLIEGIWRYAGSSLTEAVNLGNPAEFTVLELAECVKTIFSSKRLEIEFHDLPKDDPKKRRPDISKARQALGWEPKISLEDGLRRMLMSLT